MSDTATLTTNGDAAPSFDALESLLGDSSPKVEVEAEAPKTEEKQEVSASSVEKTEKVVEAPKEEKVEEKQDVSAEEKVEADPAEDVSGVKSVKFKVGPRGREVEIPMDAKITVPVNGKDEEVTLEELRKDYSGRTDWTRKYTDLDKDRQAFNADREQTEQDLSSILTKAYQDKDPAGAILQMAQIANLDPAPLYDAFQQAVIGPDLEKFLNMTDMERTNYLLQKKVDFLSRSRKEQDDAVKQKDADEALERDMSAMQTELGVKEESIKMAQERYKASPKSFEAWLKGKEPTQKDIILLADAFERRDLAEKILTKVDPELVKDPDAIQIAMQKLQGNKNINFDEAVQFAAKFFGRDTKNPVKTTEEHAKILDNKIAQAAKSLDADDGSEERSPKKKVTKEILSWDDL